MIDKDPQRGAAVISTLFAGLFLCMLAAFVRSKLPIWDKLASGEKFWTLFALVFAITLTLSGVIYAIFSWRLVGLFHGTLMLCLAGLMLYGVVFALRGPQADDPAAGIVAGANFIFMVVFIAVGTIAALCGTGVLYSTLPQEQKDSKSG